MRRRQRQVAADEHVSYALGGDDLDVQIWHARAFGANPANADVYAPRAHQRVPKPGAWAMITRQLPPMEFMLDEQIRVGRVFYVEHEENADEQGFLPNGTYKVVCRSPWHEARLWPYEYSVVAADRLTALWQDGVLLFHPLNLEPARFSHMVFYAQSRGIGLADAAVMALGTLAGPVGWFEPHPDVAPDLEAMVERINRWPWDDTKRRAAQARQPVSRSIAELVKRDIGQGWPEGYFKRISAGAGAGEQRRGGVEAAADEQRVAQRTRVLLVRVLGQHLAACRELRVQRVPVRRAGLADGRLEQILPSRRLAHPRQSIQISKHGLLSFTLRYVRL